MSKCPRCDEKLRRRKDGRFECQACDFIGDSATVLQTKSVLIRSDARLREIKAEEESINEARAGFKNGESILPLERTLNANSSISPQNPLPTLTVRRDSRRKNLLMLATIELMAFADWFLTNSSSLIEGRMTAQQAAFPFMFLFIGAVIVLWQK